MNLYILGFNKVKWRNCYNRNLILIYVISLVLVKSLRNS